MSMTNPNAAGMSEERLAEIRSRDQYWMPVIAELLAEIDRLRAAPGGVVVPEWRCFHCDSVFTDKACAALHFGEGEISTPACRIEGAEKYGLLEMVRKQEAELDRFRREDTASYREFYALSADHNRALIKAEQQGYDRGLADGRALTPEK